MSGEQGAPAAAEIKPESRDSVPQELGDFFSIGGRSLLIKGGAGTGKTTLALTLLPLLNATKNFLYLSTRESPALFQRDHPWLAEALGKGKKTAAEKSLEQTGPVGFIDARLDEPTQLFERITSQLMDATSPVIVIDTLDALDDFIDAKALKTNVRVLQTWCERAGARLVVAMEDPESSVLDPLMDGVVILRQKVLENRRLRQIDLHKLYGVRISKPSHFFTLNKGWFKTFWEGLPEDLQISPGAMLVFIPQKSRTHPGYFPTGYGELDTILGGGFTAGGLTTIQLDNVVNMKIPFLLLSRILVSFPSESKVLLSPLDGLEAEFVDKYLGLLPTAAQRRVRRLENAESASLEGVGNGPVLSIVDAGSMTPKSIKAFAELARTTKGITVAVGRESKTRAPPAYAHWAGAQMRLTYTAGTMLLASEAPFSQYLGVSVVSSNGIPSLELEPMV